MLCCCAYPLAPASCPLPPASWGNWGVEDYAQMEPPLPQGPWLSTYLVWSAESAPLITDLSVQVTPKGGVLPTSRLTNDDNAFSVNATVHLNTSGESH